MPEVSGLADRRRQIRYHRIGELKELPTPARRRRETHEKLMLAMTTKENL